jgi:hypothetical protein
VLFFLDVLPALRPLLFELLLILALGMSLLFGLTLGLLTLFDHAVGPLISPHKPVPTFGEQNLENTVVRLREEAEQGNDRRELLAVGGAADVT